MVLTSLAKAIYNRVDVDHSSIERFVTSISQRTPPGALVLDAVSGWGRFRPLFGHCRYIAQDLCVADEWNYDHLSVISDLHQLPFADNTFDVVLSMQVLEHVQDPERAIREMHRVLRPGGKLCITLPQGSKEHQVPHDYFRFTQYGLTHLLRKVQFHSYSVQPRGGYFWFAGHVLRELLFLEIFTPRSLVARLVMTPVKWVCYVLISAIRLVCYYLDRLDTQRLLTLGYQCTAEK